MLLTSSPAVSVYRMRAPAAVYSTLWLTRPILQFVFPPFLSFYLSSVFLWSVLRLLSLQVAGGFVAGVAVSLSLFHVGVWLATTLSVKTATKV